MEEVNKLNLENEKLDSVELQTYMQQTIVLIGDRMNDVYNGLIKTNEGKKNAIIYITQERERKLSSSGKLKYEDFKDEYDSSFVRMTDKNGNEMDEEDGASRISYPEIIQVRFRNLASDREFRHAAEIVSGLVDNSWVTIVASDLSEGFARNIHSSLVYRRKKFNNSVASFVFTRASNPTDEFNLKIIRESIKKNTHRYKEIGEEKKIRHNIFSKKGEEQEIQKMISEISSLQKNF
ncbi:MAG: hypothetical protein M1323_02885 [Candidatus Thermoplasmatota archaeon]|jgi:hypothetical protein|nr:hypothetical protein [Candidatus Thermoplasmatota archaeon]